MCIYSSLCCKWFSVESSWLMFQRRVEQSVTADNTEELKDNETSQPVDNLNGSTLRQSLEAETSILIILGTGD